MTLLILAGCGKYYCHCIRCEFGRLGKSVKGIAPTVPTEIEITLSDLIDGASDDEDKEIRRDEHRLKQGKSLRYHDSKSDLRSHESQRAWDKFNSDMDDFDSDF